MKNKSLFLGVIFSLLALVGQAQIVEVYRQGFESSGETYGYTVEGGTAAPQAIYQSSGSRAMRIHHTPTDTYVYTDTIDFTGNSSFSSYTLEFDHISDIIPQECLSPGNVCIIEVCAVGDPVNNTRWDRLNASHYDPELDGRSSEFAGTGSFCYASYSEWETGTISNAWWKHERFRLDVLMPQSQAHRKLQFRFHLYGSRQNNQSTRGWYIDNIVVRASPSSMNPPKLKLAAWPEDMMPYPSSRGSRVEINVTSSSNDGVCLDSCYIIYKLSNAANAPEYRSTFDVVSTTSNNLGNVGAARLRTYIPFAGYDTIVSWRVVAKDATTNHNTVTYPSAAGTWSRFSSTRGHTNQQQFSTALGATVSNNANFPFPGECAASSQYIYSKQLMQEAGYKAGAITSMNILVASNISHSPRTRVVIRAVNVDENFSVSASPNGLTPYYLYDTKVVFDSSLDLTQNANTFLTINFQDTFFYAGKSAIFQIISARQTGPTTFADPAAMTIKVFERPNNQMTLWQSAPASSLNSQYSDPFTSNTFLRGNTSNRLPDGYFTSVANLPLYYDCGISGFVTPNDTTTANANTSNDITLTLTNFGVHPINAVTIYYQVDGGAHQSYSWTGNLAGGASVPVTVTNSQTFSAGYHELRAWVDDSLLCSGTLYRDHEPFNDTAWTKMISCDGPMSGTRQVGGAGADYADMDKFLYALRCCGVNGPLHVNLYSGTYAPIAPEDIPGASAQNYILFQPLYANTPNAVKFSTNEANCSTPLVDLRNARYIRFRRINFNTTYDNNITHPVRLGVNSVGCQFLECNFNEAMSSNPALAGGTRATALLYSGGADSLVVDGCTFSRGNIGVSMVGPAADNLARGAVIKRSTFTNQATNNFVVRNHIGSIVDSNTCLDLLTGASYQMLFQDCHQGLRVTRNTAYVTSGAACLGVTDLYGTSADNAVIANNMLICADNGSANMLTTPMFIISAEYTKIVHNSVKMTAPDRAGIAAATFGGGVIDHCYFYNNIISSFDTSNFAFSYVPYGNNINYIGNNIYYSRSYILNKYDGTVCSNLTAWNTHLNDAGSQQVNPAFLGLTPTDLSTYSLNVKGHGVPIAEVTDDIYGTARDPQAPCVGAFEFANLPYDFEIVGFVEPYDEYCNVPASGAPLRVQIKNNGINDYIPGTSGNLQLTYSRTATPGVMAPGQSANLLVNTPIPGNSTVTCNFNANLNFPPNGFLDTTYTFTFWLTSAIDVNHINDTTSYTILSHYHPAAPATVNHNSPYGTPATVTVSQGIQSWRTQGYNSGRHENSKIYWYADSSYTSDPIYCGPTYTTGVLYEDTTLYVRQSRDLGIMRISEVQIKKNGVGVTYPQPMWMNANTDLAVELINVGDYPAHLLGDSLIFVSCSNNGAANSALNNKSYRFPNIVVQPGHSLVVQFRSGVTTTDSSVTVGANATLTAANTAHFGILYRDQLGIADAVAFNDVTTLRNNQNVSIWANRNVPAAVWSGAGIPLSTVTNTAGASRISWPTNPNASPSNSAQYWQIADSSHYMGIGTDNSNMVLYTSNGCLGDPAPVNIHLTNLPSADLALDSIVVPEGCGLGNEPVTVTVHNFGAQNSGPFTLTCSVNGTVLCSDNIASIGPRGAVTHTFSQLADMYVPTGIQDFNFRVWVNHINGDNTLINDTTSISVTSSYTPTAPVVTTHQTAQYATRLLLSTVTPSADTLRWYDRFMQELATANNYLTPFIFRPDTFYVAALAPTPNNIHIGTLASVNANTAYPSPFNPNKRYGQEQYLFKAEELIEAGHAAGPITGLAFYLDTVRVAGGSITMTNFTLGIGTTPISAFNNGNNTPQTKWQTVEQVYAQSNMTLSNSNKGWVHFNFTTPFIWDGESNIVVGITREMSAAQTAGAQTRYTAAFTGSAYQKNDANARTLNVGADGNGSPSANRPDVRFQFQDFGCESPVSPIYIDVTGNPDCDAVLEWPAEYDTALFASCGNTDIDVMLTNNGSSPILNASIQYWVDNLQGTHTCTTAIPFDSTARVTVVSTHLTPGRHYLKAIVSVPGDTILVNDTIERIISVSFCAGNYTIGPSAGNDYPSFNVALDTLYGAGVAGPVVFNVESGTYTTQLTIGSIRGTSRDNTVTFRPATGNVNDVQLVYTAITAANNYVLKLDGAQWVNFSHFWINANGSTPASSTAVQIYNSSDIHFTACRIEVKSTTNNVNSNGLIVNDGVTNLYIDSTEFSGGYHAICSKVTAPGLSSGMYFNGNSIHGFWFGGITMRKVNGLSMRHNDIQGGVTISGRALTGIYVAEVEGGVNIERNIIVLSDNVNGGKRPIVLTHCVGTNLDRSRISNNMCVGRGTGTNNAVPTGITIDSNSAFVNVYFNSVSIYAGANAPTTRAFAVDHNSSSVYVLNNIFSNFSKGYAYWLFNVMGVAQSNYNVFYTDENGDPVKLAKVGNTEIATLDELRAETGKEANSLFSQPYFKSNTDLHLRFGLYNEMALYLPEVTNDVDGTTRPAIPAPCIGAHEYVRCIHDVAIMQFVTPTLDENPIESDTLQVTMKLLNNGTSTETNLWWRANIVGHPELVTPTVTIREMAPGEQIISTSYIVMPMGIIDTQRIEAVFSDNLVNQCDTGYNYADTVFFLDMAYDLMLTGNDAITVTTDVGFGEGCRLWAAPITIKVNNKGRKPVPTDIPFTIGYEVRLPSSANYTVAQIPLVHEETYTLTAPIPENDFADVTFAVPVNIYPTGNSRDISVRIRAWVSHPNDQKHVGNNSKDTTGTIVGNNPWNNWKSVNSKYLPNPPIGNDLHIPYGTWDTITASQSEIYPGTTAGRPIMWYRDSTDAEPFHAPSQYARSCWWETPQYYHDSTYYLACVSASSCTSYYSPVNVFLNPRIQNDVSIMSDTHYYTEPHLRHLNPVFEPYSKVFQNNDTVKVRIVNYGSNPVSNIPVYYQLRRAGNNQPVMQEVREVCTATIQPDSTYLFKFDSLVELPYVNQNYTLRVWTALDSDPVRENDTIRHLHTFTTLPESTYETPNISSPGGVDIVRVSFNSLNNEIPEVGRNYGNFADFNHPEVPVLNMIKGTTDTMIVEVANSDNHGDHTTGGFITMMIDFDRDGVFDNTDPEVAQYGGYTEVFYANNIVSRQPLKFVYTIPDDMCLGYMRMRLVYEQSASSIYSDLNYMVGCVHDYLLHIEDAPVETDAALSRIVSPISRFLPIDSVGDTTVVTVLLTNKGASAITSAEIGYRIHHVSGTTRRSFQWSGNLEPGQSVPVSLPGHYLTQGTHRFIIWANTYGDTISENDTIRYEYHRFKVQELVLQDLFENDRGGWFAPHGYNDYSQNVWEIGVPRKARLNSAISDTGVLATNINGMVNATRLGNLSYIYTPYFNISNIRPDSLCFWMASSMSDSMVFSVEYLDYRGYWVTLGDGNVPDWYNIGNGFTGATPGYAYRQCNLKIDPVTVSNFPQYSQFRFVYLAHPGAPTDDGVVVDNVRVTRARRAIDVGVVAITHPTEPRFGEIIYPRVAIKNFGYDSIHSVTLAYRPYGSNLPKTGTYTGVIGPGDTKIYTFDQPFTVMADFPDTFQICAFTTVNMDIYWENDSTCKDFGLAPLDNDLAITDILYPLDRIVAGDSIEVTVRLRNYGQSPVTSANVTYVFNHNYTVTETVNFAATLPDGALGPYEYYNYTFRQKCRATLGTMNMECFCDLPEDDYRFNDTISKAISGISSIVDIRARSVVIDRSYPSATRFQLNLDNAGALAANDFEIGFYIDNDTSTVFRQMAHIDPTFPALTSQFIYFDTTLPERAYNYITAWVTHPDDNDHSNDTTSLIEEASCDLKACKVLVEENANDVCKLRLVVENVGNLSYYRTMITPMTVTVNEVSQNLSIPGGTVISPQQVIEFDCNRTIPKSPNRHYEGYAQITFADVDTTNNETSIVEVVNYFGAPVVDHSGMMLDQNYPNPYETSTRIDFRIPTSGTVRFFVMDAMGRLVYQSEKDYPAGDHSIRYQPDGLSAGVYYYGIEMNDDRLMRKMVYKK